MFGPSKKIIRAVRYINEIEDLLCYFTGEHYNTMDLTTDDKCTKLVQKVTFIKDVLNDLGIDKKQHDRRLWNHFKKLVGTGERNV